MKKSGIRSIQPGANRNGLLTPYRLIDLTDDRGSLCGMILGGLGVEVIKVEKPGGDPSRSIGPFFQDIPGCEKSLYWLAYNANKRGLTLDLTSRSDQESFKQLVSISDFLIESFAPGHMTGLGLGYHELKKLNPGLIMVSISPFGQSGPYRDYLVSNLIAEAMGGLTFITGDPDKRPVSSGFQLAYRHAGLQAALGALIAHHYKQRTGKGQLIDLSIQEAVLGTLQLAPYLWFYSKRIQRRTGAKTTWGEKDGQSQVVYPCKDGYILWRMYTGGLGWQTRNLAEWMAEEGMSEGLNQINWPQVDMASLSPEQMEEWESIFAKFFLTKTKKQLFPAVIDKGIMVFPLYNAEDLLKDRQMEGRNFWKNFEQPGMNTNLIYPGVPMKSSEVYFECSRPPSKDKDLTSIEKRIEGNRAQALDDLKIIDLGWIFAGPFVSRFLADYGATVVKVESNTRVDPLRTMSPYAGGKIGVNRGTYFLWHNPNKYSISIDFNHAKGLELFKRLVRWADVLVENFTPGTLEKLGLGYEELKKVNPSLILIRLSAVGQKGPYAHMRGLGQMLKGLTGLANTGMPGDIPTPNPVAHTDFISGFYFSCAVLAALDYLRRNGKGQCIDGSQVESAAMFYTTAILDYVANQRIQSLQGNWVHHASPHNVYRCLGEERWCVICVQDEEQWKRFCEVMGNPNWAANSNFSTLAGRKENEEELDRHIEKWTVNYPPEEIMEKLQGAGIAAGVVKNSQELFQDPQLIHREHFWYAKHPEAGTTCGSKPSYKLTETPVQIKMAAPCLGEHTEFVCCELLGMEDDEFVQLLTEGVLN
jgi:crotonobetainyl-CoA:carnitine CoA-transferase CaiB-like acyl-CoA transferase